MKRFSHQAGHGDELLREILSAIRMIFEFKDKNAHNRSRPQEEKQQARKNIR
jgi:hypothetical protein